MVDKEDRKKNRSSLFSAISTNLFHMVGLCVDIQNLLPFNLILSFIKLVFDGNDLDGQTCCQRLKDSIQFLFHSWK